VGAALPQRWLTQQVKSIIPPCLPRQGIVFIKRAGYPVGMNTNIEPQSTEQIAVRTGNWLLVVGPRAICPTLLALTARLAEAGPVRVVDGGNRFNVYTVARAARGRSEVLNRITVSRAFTCYQALSLLESTPAIQAPFVVLDLLNTFYDENVQAGERKRLLGQCLTNLDRLEKESSGLVSVHPAAVHSQTGRELLEMIQAAARDSYHVQMAAPALEPMRLF